MAFLPRPPALDMKQIPATLTQWLRELRDYILNETAGGTVTSITAGTGLSGGTITSSGTIALAATAVTAGSYTNTSLTVNAEGQITAASSGSSSGVTSTFYTNSLGSNVATNNTSNYFDGPSVAQGTTAGQRWFASGTATIAGVSGDSVVAQLWDGTTLIASSYCQIPSATIQGISLSGVITSPAGNIKLSVRNFSSTTGNILASESLGKSSTITVVRIA